MRVQFYVADQNPGRDRSRGITEYTHGLLDQLRLRDGIELSCLASRSSYRPTNAATRVHSLPFRTDHTAGRLLSDQLHPFLYRGDADLWHYPKGFLSWLWRPRTPTVGTVHDTILAFYAEHYPESRSRAAFAYWCDQLARSLARFDRVLTVSEFSKGAIQAFCERRRIRTPPIDVTYEGARWEHETPDLEAKRDGVVHLCSPLPHKRTDTLLDFWEILQRETPSPLPLQLIGHASERQRERIARLRHVQHRPPLGSSELRSALTSAAALVISSEIEGFGVPTLEAYYLGTPVVYVRGTAVHEVLGGDAPGGFQLDSFDSFRSALEEVLDLGPEAIQQTSERLRRRFAWSACADRTVEAYRELL